MHASRCPKPTAYCHCARCLKQRVLVLCLARDAVTAHARWRALIPWRLFATNISPQPCTDSTFLPVHDFPFLVFGSNSAMTTHVRMDNAIHNLFTILMQNTTDRSVLGALDLTSIGYGSNVGAVVGALLHALKLDWSDDGKQLWRKADKGCGQTGAAVSCSRLVS